MLSKILVVDDEHGLREMLRVLLERAGYQVQLASGQRTALAAMQSALEPPDLVITDLSMPDGSGMDVLGAARTLDVNVQVIMITAYATMEQAVQAMREGAYDYIQKPFKNEELLAVVDKALEKRQLLLENLSLRARVAADQQRGSLVGKSRAMQQVMQLVQRIASAPTSVLITGESGTGKEMVARALHELSDRAKAPFIAINCAALPEALLESELFGHEKGAFTGATERKEGLFRAAEGGTLLLDEIGELPLSLQVKLLRALQEKRVRPVGGQKEYDIHVRVVAATNRNLKDEVLAGRFREDLFYRLNVINLHLPPLRERPEDVALLAEHFLAKHAAAQGKKLQFSAAALRHLVEREYKGNVRELENAVERAVTLALGDEVSVADLVPFGEALDAGQRPRAVLPEEGMDLDLYLADIEKQLLVSAMERSAGVRKDAAKLLGMTFRSFRYRLAKYDLGSAEEEDDES